MKLGILSDTHNHRGNLTAALEAFRREGIATLVHCGDMTGPALVPLFTGFELHYVFGNVDGGPAEVAKAIRDLGKTNTAGREYHGEFDGKSVAVTHGDHADLLEELIRSGQFDYVLHGHTHRRRDERIGRTRVINPGALGGLHVQSRSICILEPASDQPRFVEIAD